MLLAPRFPFGTSRKPSSSTSTPCERSASTLTRTMNRHNTAVRRGAYSMRPQMATTETRRYRGYKIVPLRQWAGWCAEAYPRGLIYPSLRDLLCALWLRGRKPPWPKPNRASTAFSLPSVGDTRPCTHKSRLVSSGWSLSALPSKADIQSTGQAALSCCCAPLPNRRPEQRPGPSEFHDVIAPNRPAL